MTVPLYSDGQPLLIADASEFLSWDIATKAVNTSRASTTTLAADPDLALAVLGDAAYEVRAAIFYDGNGGGQDIAWQWAVPVGSVIAEQHANWYAGTFALGSTTGGSTLQADTGSPTDQEVIWATANLQMGTTPGTISFSWAQGSSSSTATAVLANSFLMIRRVA